MSTRTRKTVLSTLALSAGLVALGAAAQMGVIAQAAAPDGSSSMRGSRAIEGCFEAPVPRQRPSAVAEGCTDTPLPTERPAMLRSKLYHQVRYHQSFPVAKAPMLAAFRASAELSRQELSWLAGKLEDRTFASGADLLRSLFHDAPAQMLARLELPPTRTTVASR